MTKSVAESLIKNVAFVEKDMAKRYLFFQFWFVTNEVGSLNFHFAKK